METSIKRMGSREMGMLQHSSYLPDFKYLKLTLFLSENNIPLDYFTGSFPCSKWRVRVYVLTHVCASLQHDLKVRQMVPWRFSGKESAYQHRRHRFDSWVGKIPWGRKWQPTPIFLPGQSRGQRSLVDYSPWGHEEYDMTYNKCLAPCLIRHGKQWEGIWLMSLMSWAYDAFL